MGLSIKYASCTYGNTYIQLCVVDAHLICTAKSFKVYTDWGSNIKMYYRINSILYIQPWLLSLYRSCFAGSMESAQATGKMFCCMHIFLCIHTSLLPFNRYVFQGVYFTCLAVKMYGCVYSNAYIQLCAVDAHLICTVKDSNSLQMGDQT